MRIETIVAGLPYEPDPCPAVYAPGTIAELEAALARPLPHDLRWYLANVGWRRLQPGQRTILVPRNDNLLALEFEAAEHEAFALNRYDDLVRGTEGALLPHDRRSYLPLGKLTGYGSPSIALHLLVNLNDDDHGSLWAVPTTVIAHRAPSPPVRVAADLASFLLAIGPASRLTPQAEQHEEDLFNRLLAQHLASQAPTTMQDPQALVVLALHHPFDLVPDGARNVEYAHRANSLRVETPAEFAEVAARWTAPPAAFPARRNASIGQSQPFDRLHAFHAKSHGYALVTVESLVGEGDKLSEEYLLHRTEAGWTLVRRYAAAVSDRRVRNLGTLTYDETQGWALRKKVKPLWSDLPVELRVGGDEAALTPSRIAFTRQVIDHAAFRPLFEDHVFRLYTEVMRPEFEAMPEAEQADWAPRYPTLTEPGEVWALLRRPTLWIDGDDTFHLQSAASWDPEHGLTVRVRAWQIIL